MKKRILIITILMVVVSFILICFLFLKKTNVRNEDKYYILGKYLEKKGWKRDSSCAYCFYLTIEETFDEKGKPINIDKYFIYLAPMRIHRVHRMSKLGVTLIDYYLKHDISTGKQIYLNEKEEDVSKVSFSYNFKSGILSIDDKSSSNFCIDISIDIKDYLESIIIDANLKLEDFK